MTSSDGIDDPPKNERALSESVFDDGLMAGDSIDTRVRSWFRSSAVGRHAEDTWEGFLRILDDSALVGAGFELSTVARGSFCYRWLTAEPEPEVIVIDLTETRTVAPFLRVVDVILDALCYSSLYQYVYGTIAAGQELSTREVGLVLLVTTAWNTIIGVLLGIFDGANLYLTVGLALVGFAGYRWNVPLSDIRTSRPVRLIVSQLEPPSPPDTADGDGEPRENRQFGS